MPGLHERLAEVSLFQGLTPHELDVIVDLAEERRFDAGARLFTEGDPVDALWIILAGDVEIAKANKLLAEMGPGAVIGELSLLRSMPRRSATVSAICPVEALRVPVTGFQKLLQQSNVAALKVVANVARQMAERLDALNERLITPGKKGLSVARSELRRVVL